jgi:5-methylthioribose kinase
VKKEGIHMNEANVIKYVKEKIDIFDKESELKCVEIGDGNINYIYKVWDPKNDKSIILKHADNYMRNSTTRKLSTNRSIIEYEILKIQGSLTNNMVPQIYSYDDEMFSLVMEDLSKYQIMRKALLEYKTFPKFADQISDFLFNTLFKTTDLVLNPEEKKRLTKEFINPEMCEITERLVLTEPYKNLRNTNIIQEENLGFIEKELYNDEQLLLEIGKLKNNFKNNAQSLIHGDLHTGSIFVDNDNTKVIDPEFAFYGPMGYDIGNVIANLIFAWIRAKVNENKTLKIHNFIIWAETSIAEIIDLFIKKYNERYDDNVIDQVYRNKLFKEFYLRSILSDTAGYAGTEIIRRTVGVAKVEEILKIEDKTVHIATEKNLVLIGKSFVMNRDKMMDGSSYLNYLKNNFIY